MRDGSGGGGSVSVCSLFTDATGGCSGGPDWSAGHREMGSDVGIARASRLPRTAGGAVRPGPAR